MNNGVAVVKFSRPAVSMEYPFDKNLQGCQPWKVSPFDIKIACIYHSIRKFGILQYCRKVTDATILWNFVAADLDENKLISGRFKSFLPSFWQTQSHKERMLIMQIANSRLQYVSLVCYQCPLAHYYLLTNRNFKEDRSYAIPFSTYKNKIKVRMKIVLK